MERAPKGSKASPVFPAVAVADEELKGSPAKGSDGNPDEAGKACPAKGSSVTVVVCEEMKRKKMINASRS